MSGATREQPGTTQAAFRPRARALANAQDVLMCYQILLGRDPESAAVIEEARTQPVFALLTSCAASAEFATAVRSPLEAGGRLPHDAWSSGPDREHIIWLLDQIAFEPEDSERLRIASTWADLLCRLAEPLPGLSAPQASPAAAPPAEPNELLVMRCAIAALEANLHDVRAQLRDLQQHVFVLVAQRDEAHPARKPQPAVRAAPLG